MRIDKTRNRAASRVGIFALALSTVLVSAALVEAQDDDVGSTTAAACCGSECCSIGGCRGRGEVNPADSCQQCDPDTSQSAWTDIAGCAPAADTGTDSGGGGTDSGSGGGDDGGGCSATSFSSGGAVPAAFLALMALFGIARRRR